ncbi:MAG: aromatic amino acid transaminase [Parvularculaceae bacterium]|nr:aromatic amino acid transaminase [Parvularculaceae bacterium]
MFADLAALPPDPLLGVTQRFRADPRPEKIDLGVGVFRNRKGETPVMRAVAAAQRRLVEKETTKVYLPPESAPGFAPSLSRLIFGDTLSPRVALVQTPGGSGALRVAAELLKRAGAQAIIVPAPTWANHQPLLGASGLSIRSIPYYDATTGGVDFAAYYDAAALLGPKDALLIHAGCHNPSGADLTREQTDAVIDLAAERKFLPFIDAAYHGFAEGLDADTYIVRAMAGRLPEFLVAYSCSKNFGLYRERTGAIAMVGTDDAAARAMMTHAVNVGRQMYSMPPAHGALLVAEVLGDPALERDWRAELEEMRLAVKRSRTMLVEAGRNHQLGGSLDHLLTQNGMFSLLPINETQVTVLREKHALHFVNSGRINLCAVNEDNAARIAEALSAVMRG